MNNLQQTELDLAGSSLESRWNLNMQREAENWTDEARCIQWVWPKSDWKAHKEWWAHLCEYERTQLLNMWLCRRKGQTYAQAQAAVDYAYERDKELAEHWAKQIRAAAIDRKPPPFRPAERVKHIYEWACEMAGVIVVEAEQQKE